jgi:hypothetical protein
MLSGAYELCMLSVIMLSATYKLCMLNVVMLSIIMLSVMPLLHGHGITYFVDVVIITVKH